MGSERITVLHVEPDEQTRDDIAERIEGWQDMLVVGAGSIEEATEQVAETPPDCVVAEYSLPDGTAFDLFSGIREENPDTACLLYTDAGFAEMDTDPDNPVIAEYLSKRIPGSEKRLPGMVRDTVSERFQVGYPVPEAEDERLEAVRQFDLEKLSTAEAFERLTTLARKQFGVDQAFIGVMKASEEEIVACQGSQLSMLDRENAVCTYSIVESDVTVIDDVGDDPRFKYNERLEELGIKSYAGADLTTADGRVVGEFCLLDSESRSYDAEERETLQLFASEAMEQMELRRRLTQTAPEGE